MNRRVLVFRNGIALDPKLRDGGVHRTLVHSSRKIAAFEGGATGMGEATPMTDIAWMYETDDAEPNDEERSSIEAGIAEQIAVLSEADESPEEFELQGDACSPDEVVFHNESWMKHVAGVQGWLRPPADLVVSDRTIFLSALAEMLGLAQGDLLTVQDRLSMDGLTRLDERLSTAIQAREVFLEELGRESGTRSSATAAWVEAWEVSEQEEPDDTPPDPVSAEADVWRIVEFVGRAEEGQLELAPSYQRGDVWPTKDAQMLMESILRGIPLPSIILLSPSNDPQAPAEVVDGKQRLTAILRFIGRHPRALEAVEKFDKEHPEHHLKESFENDYPAFRRAWKNLRGETLSAVRESELYFPFKLRTGARELGGELEPLQGKYYSQIKDHPVRILNSREKVSSIFERMSAYKVPVIIYSKATQRQIHEVFNLYNRQGKHLNAEEIRNAIFHGLDITRGILVAAGDANHETAFEKVAPFLRADERSIAALSETLAGYNFGTARYRRTKILSWILALLLLDSRDGEKAVMLSTAGQIDALLRKVEENPKHPLRDLSAIREALRVVAIGVEAHAGHDYAWAPRFRDGTATGTKWQELQLIGSLTGVLAASVYDPGGVGARIAEASGELREASLGWKRPKKTQTQEQWKYIAQIARGVVDILDIDVEEVNRTLCARFGESGLANLWAVKGYEDVQ